MKNLSQCIHLFIQFLVSTLIDFQELKAVDYMYIYLFAFIQ